MPKQIAALALVLAGASAPHCPSSTAQSTAAAPAVPGLHVEPCTVAGVARPARCGTLEVWENRAAGAGRRIALRFVVVPVTGAERPRGAVTFLHGGPGAAATTAARRMAELFAPSLEDRDLLLVDQRGTGRSNPLYCPGLYGFREEPAGYLGSFLPADRVRACVPELQRRADLAHYTTDPAADDLDEVRAALGYERLDLYGASYGTRLALVYMRRHPGRVRSVVLLGVAPTDAAMPLRFAPDAERALSGVLAGCAAEAACRAAFPDLRGDARRALERLARAPAEVEVVNPATGRAVRIALTRELFGEAIRYLLYTPAAAGQLPAMVHQAARGDFAPIAEVALERRLNLVGSQSTGVFLAVTCAEDVPFADPAEGARLARGTFLGGYRLRDQRAACGAWPRAPLAPGYREPTVSDVPTLILSGQWDPATPPRHGEEVARHLRNSLHVVVPGGAHGFDGLEGSACVDRVMNDFVRAASVAALDTSCVRTVRRRPFRTAPVRAKAAPADGA